MIAKLGEDKGLLAYLDEDARKDEHLRIRHTLAQIRKNNDNELRKGDCKLIYLEGQASTPGWKGHRWKDAMHS